MVAIKKTALPKKPPPTQRRRLFVPSRPSSDAAAGPSAPLRNKGDLEEAIEAMADARGCKSATISDYTLRCRKMFKEDTGSEQVTGRDNRRFTRSANFLDTTVTSKEETKARPSDADKLLARKPKPSPFDVSPQKKNQKPIKLNLDDSEVKPAPKRWRQQLEVLSRQRKRIIAPVDEMGCEENGRDDRRADAWRREDEQEKLKRERFTVLVSLMLSSQTKDETTAQAVKNLQSNLPLGLSLQGILTATDDEISSNINKVGFWRRKTGYIKSAASIIASTFNGDVPKNVDELCSLPGVGPKMAFLCLQSAWQINLGIGVDVHVHRLSNRLGWCKTNDPEATRLVLQSWLPKKLHHSINKTLVGFGQVICVPVGPRCDLCDLGKARLCPSYRKVDPKAANSRKQVVLLPETDECDTTKVEAKVEIKEESEAKVAVVVEGPDGRGTVKTEVLRDLPPVAETQSIKTELASSLAW